MPVIIISKIQWTLSHFEGAPNVDYSFFEFEEYNLIRDIHAKRDEVGSLSDRHLFDDSNNVCLYAENAHWE